MSEFNASSSNPEQNPLIDEVNESPIDSNLSFPPETFQANFVGMMEMYSDENTVCDYLRDHQGWFVRCAEPMKAVPFGDNGYTLIVGRYGAFGYHVEPQMSVILEPPQSKHYAMYSVPNSEFNHQGYSVNYRSEMDIESIPVALAGKGIEKAYQKKGNSTLPDVITKINWRLSLGVEIIFPAFIYKLPMSVIKNTGDRLLTQIIKQVSLRLSYKVQKDFHEGLDLPIPPATGRILKPVS